MNPLTQKQIQQIAKENNISFEMDDMYHLPIVFSGNIILKATIEYDKRYDGWQMSSNSRRKTATELSKMNAIKNLLNGLTDDR